MTHRIASLTLVSLTAVLTALALPAQAAADAKGDLSHHHKALDTNGDKVLSPDEVKSAPILRQNFEEIDTDKSGTLTGKEIATFLKAHKGQVLNESWDANEDGVVSREEAAKFPRLAKNFDALDTNKDGKLSKEELDKGKELMKSAAAAASAAKKP